MKPLRDDGGWTPQGREQRDQKPKILYVEDDPQNRLVAAQRLGDEYDLVMAANDREACAAVTAHAGTLTCLLVDIQLQGSTLSGIELTRLIRGLPLAVPVPDHARDLPVLKVPIVFLTAYGASFSDKELIGTGGNYLFAKPVNFARLSLMLKQIQIRQLQGSFSRS